MRPRRPASLAPIRRGFSLIELMISLAIGMVVVAAVLATYLASGTAARNTMALSQVTDDGNIALNVMRQQIAMIGYSKPIEVVNGGDFKLAYQEVGLFGCDAGFSDASVAIGSLACAATSAGGSNAIAMAFEADASTTPVSNNKPLDCTGNELAQSSPSGASLYLSYSRFYLATPSGAARTALYCYGSGSTTPQVLVSDVVDLAITYGVAAPDESGVFKRVGYYSSAAGLTADQFSKVRAIRVCVVVASTNEVMDEATPYQPCNPFASPVTPTDKRLYKAFSATVGLQNRLGSLTTGT